MNFDSGERFMIGDRVIRSKGKTTYLCITEQRAEALADTIERTQDNGFLSSIERIQLHGRYYYRLTVTDYDYALDLTEFDD